MPEGLSLQFVKTEFNQATVYDTCFHKTETDTAHGVVMWGAMATHRGMSRPLEETVSGQGWHQAGRVVTQMADDSLLMLGMTTCHELNIIEDLMVGEPLDEKMFSSTEWSMEVIRKEGAQLDQLSVRSPRTASNSVILAAQQKVFQFSSHMERMSVITRVMEETEKGVTEPVTMVFCKGSPEMIQRLCRPESIPTDFDQVLEKCGAPGFQTIALAGKVLHRHPFDENVLERMTREQTEVDNDLLGLIIMEARMEEAEVIPQLDGWADIEVHCELCNHPFEGKNKNRCKQDHLITRHFHDYFRGLAIEKIDGFFSCPENCDKKFTLKSDVFRHLAGTHKKLDTLIANKFPPPNKQNNQDQGMQEDFENLIQLDDDGAVSASNVGGDDRHQELLTHEVPSFIDEVLKKLYETDSTNEAFTSWKEAGISAKMVNSALIHMLERIMKNSNSGQRKIAMDLVDQLFGSDLITGVQIKDSLVKIVSTMDSNSDTASQVTMAEMSAWAVLTDKLKLTEVAAITEGGASHPLFFSVLKVMASRDKEATLASIKDIKLMDQLPTNLRTEEQLGDQLEQMQLSFLVCGAAPCQGRNVETARGGSGSQEPSRLDQEDSARGQQERSRFCINSDHQYYQAHLRDNEAEEQHHFREEGGHQQEEGDDHEVQDCSLQLPGPSQASAGHWVCAPGALLK